MNNFKEIAEKCLKGELSGTFILRNDARIPSRRLYKRTANFIITDPYVFNGLPYTYGDTGTRYPTYEEEYDVINFIPDMEERNVKLTLNKAKEWYKKGGELKEVALQAYTEEELKVYRPKSWEEYCRKCGDENFEHYFISSNFKIDEIYWIVMLNSEKWRGVLPTKELAEAFLAYMQLIALRKAWIGEWKPNWDNDGQSKFCIAYEYNNIRIWKYGHTERSLSFPTQEMAEEFVHCFQDLLKEARQLI